MPTPTPIFLCTNCGTTSGQVPCANCGYTPTSLPIPIKRRPETMTLRDYFPIIRDLCKSKGWRDDLPADPKLGKYEFAAYLALLHSEASEALEAYRDKVWSETCMATVPGMTHHKVCSGKPHSHPKPVGVGPEMADIFIRLIDMCDIWDINLTEEVTRVMEFGWTRSFKHGGREL